MIQHFWSPDTCDCKVEVDNNNDWVASPKRCNEPAHKNASGSAHYTVLLAHNRSFNLKHGNTPTKEQDEEISQDKANEKARIRGIVNG